MTPLAMFLAQLLNAWRHVRTGGASTRHRAHQRAAMPPELCPRCRQPIPHSPHWHDHL